MGKQSRRKWEAREERAQLEQNGGKPGKTRTSGGGRSVPADAYASERTFPIYWVLGGVVAIAAILAIATMGNKDTAPTDTFRATSSSLKIDGDDLPDFPDSANASANDPAKGKQIPNITGDSPTKKGPRITVGPAAAAGKPFVIFVMAHWCPHCNAEVPRLVEEWKANGEPQGVELFTIATANADDRPNFPAGKWLAQNDWKVQTMLDDENDLAADVYGVLGFPFFIFGNADGTVNYRTSGEIPVSEFNKRVDALVAK